MTTINPTSGNNPGLPEIRGYISDVQNRMCRLSGIMTAVAYLVNEDACQEGQAALIYMADEMAKEIFVALDSVNLPGRTI